MLLSRQIQVNSKGFTMTNTPPPPGVDFEGLWKNGLQSEMELSVNGNKVTGKYRANVGAPQPTEEFDLVGWATEDLITFTVNFGKYGSLTAWVGQHTEVRPGEYEIRTLWHLAKDIPDADEHENLWAAVLAGANTFFTSALRSRNY